MRRSIFFVAGTILLGAIALVVIRWPAANDGPPRLTVDWAGTEDSAACVYDATAHTVTATLRIDGNAGREDTMTLTVTAYADENTSIPVGSKRRIVRLHGEVHQRVRVTIPVTEPPHVGEDDVTACRREVAY